MNEEMNFRTQNIHPVTGRIVGNDVRGGKKKECGYLNEK